MVVQVLSATSRWQFNDYLCSPQVWPFYIEYRGHHSGHKLDVSLGDDQITVPRVMHTLRTQRYVLLNTHNNDSGSPTLN